VSAVEVVESYLSGLPGPARRLGRGEWGLSLEAETAGGYPLDVGLRIADELLRVQAPAVPAAHGLDPWLLLHWNRQTRLVRFGSTRAGDLWVHADAPVAGLDERAVDRLLGLVVQGAVRAREYAAAVAAAGEGAEPTERSWLSGSARPPAAD
jgi:hypothetical protein